VLSDLKNSHLTELSLVTVGGLDSSIVYLGQLQVILSSTACQFCDVTFTSLITRIGVVCS